MAEFLASLILSIATIGTAAGLLRDQWERTRCAYLTFEAVHGRLTQSAPRAERAIQLTETSDGVQGSGACGRARERVELRWLDGPP